MDDGGIGFFTAQPFMVGGEGFPLFGLAHIFYLVYGICLIAFLVYVYAGLPEGLRWSSPRRTMLLVVAGVPIVLLLSQDIIMFRAGVFGVQWWPLHSCNICEFLALIYAVKPNRFCGEVLFTLGIVGALAALLFPNWSYCPPWSWPVLCGFTEHSLIIGFVVMQLFGGDLKPDRRSIWKPLVLLCVYSPLAYAFNRSFGTNFFFVNAPAEGSPMVAVADVFGNPGYLVPFAVVLIASWFGLYALWDALERRGIPHRFRKRRERRRGEVASRKK